LEFILIFILICVVPGIVKWIRLKMLPKEEQTVVCIPQWQEKHFVKDSQKGKRSKLVYKASDEVKFDLGAYASSIGAMTKQAEKLVTAFQERKRSRKTLDKQFRSDPMLDKIQHTFLITMGQYISELQLFQFDRMSDDAYCRKQITRLQELLGSSEELLRHYGDYLTSLAKSATTDTTAEREWIATNVQSMEATVNAVQNGVPEEEIPVTQAELDALAELEQQVKAETAAQSQEGQ